MGPALVPVVVAPTMTVSVIAQVVGHPDLGLLVDADLLVIRLDLGVLRLG